MFADRLCVTRCCFAGLVLQAGPVTEHDYSLSLVRLDPGITILRDLTGSAQPSCYHKVDLCNICF